MVHQELAVVIILNHLFMPNKSLLIIVENIIKITDYKLLSGDGIKMGK
tara:strand:- start:1614 stop:1757 length:144 start_codon:yes stop_codon:yes gene_type:complete